MKRHHRSDRRGGVALCARAGLLAVLFGAAACSSLPPPFGTPYQEFRGYKARTFVGTPDQVRPAVIETLRGLGYEVLIDGADTTYLSAVRGMDQGRALDGAGLGIDDPTLEGAPMNGEGLEGEALGAASPTGQREWTRVGVQIRQVDNHRRAPRTLVEIEAERVQGSSEGAIEASFGAGTIPSDFYQSFFRDVEARVEKARPRQIYGLRPPA